MKEAIEGARSADRAMSARPRPQRGWAPLAAAVVVGCAAGVLLTMLLTGPVSGLGAPAYARSVAPESQSYIVEAVRKVGPAVVNISTTTQVGGFFGVFPREGQASGVIIDKRGYVLTNNHVLENADHVSITLADGRKFDATTVGLDPSSDIAVARIKGSNLPVAELGTSADKPVGSWVIAIGNPFGYENTVTVGVLSGRNRRLEAAGGAMLYDLLQTDAAINPGNSGGALVDIEGKVIGIPTAIINYAQGIGFAISAESARQVATQLIETGRVVHPWLGIGYLAVTPDLQQELKLPDRKGALITGVEPDSPAARAGLKLGDVVLRADSTELPTEELLGEIIAKSAVGRKLELTVRREGKEIKLTVTVGERPATQQ
jgi:serine protease Do